MKNCTKMRISMITRGINQTYQLQKGGAGKKAQFPQPAVRLKSLTNDTLEIKQKNTIPDLISGFIKPKQK